MRWKPCAESVSRRRARSFVSSAADVLNKMTTESRDLGVGIWDNSAYCSLG